MDEDDFRFAINEAGGKVYIVGGWVRDHLLGAVPHDRDYVVAGVEEGVFLDVFPGAARVGGKFPVYRLEIGGDYCDVAFARCERKRGLGYRGFEVIFSRRTTIEEDLYRRDTTINAMAIDLQNGELVDPFGGAKDASDGVVRAVSERFLDDPVRALRAARQACRFGFRIESGTVHMMKLCRDELRGEPRERFVNELALALNCAKPSVFFVNLLDAEILDVTFPQLHALVGVTQLRELHSGDVFAHSMEAVDRAAALSGRVEVRFAALVHDLGKAFTPGEILSRHYGRDKRGVAALLEWNRRSPLPARWRRCAEFAIREHMRAWEVKKTSKIADLLERIGRCPLGFDGFDAVLRADRCGTPRFWENRAELVEAMASSRAADAPPGLSGAALGRWIRERRTMAVAAMIPHHLQL
ncbi:MAG: HD domain-containing protein [Synergistaceae bacterium]|jgi:tRNA nucleotidyltransferase (CCA-adding enzyme)|nr:HD domain-containing protein [Synergistaceae bacterium]